MKENSSSTLILPNGRKLTYSDHGDPRGSPLFYFHGIPGSRQEYPFTETLLQTLGIRLITPDRPGYGLSDFQQDRTLLDWPADVAQLADALKLDQFAVLGFSGGGLYALACAHDLGERLSATGISGCPAPLDAAGMLDSIPAANRALHELAARDPGQLEQQLAPASPAALMAMFEEPAPPADKAMFAHASFRAMHLQNLSEALHQGAKATAWDLHLMGRPWGFDLTHIQKPIHLWHGTNDRNIPMTMGRYLAKTLPRCTAHFLDDEGHYSVFRHAESILQKLMSA